MLHNVVNQCIEVSPRTSSDSQRSKTRKFDLERKNVNKIRRFWTGYEARI